jgi:hypothetical protein
MAKSVNKNRYKLLGFATWKGGKWYLRRRAHSSRVLVLLGVGGIAALAGAAGVARRSANGSA